MPPQERTLNEAARKMHKNGCTNARKRNWTHKNGPVRVLCWHFLHMPVPVLALRGYFLGSRHCGGILLGPGLSLGKMLAQALPETAAQQQACLQNSRSSTYKRVSLHSVITCHGRH